MSMKKRRSSTRDLYVVQNAPLVDLALSAYNGDTLPTSRLDLRVSSSNLKGSSIRKIEALWKTFSEEALALI